MTFFVCFLFDSCIPQLSWLWFYFALIVFFSEHTWWKSFRLWPVESSHNNCYTLQEKEHHRFKVLFVDICWHLWLCFWLPIFPVVIVDCCWVSHLWKHPQLNIFVACPPTYSTGRTQPEQKGRFCFKLKEIEVKCNHIPLSLLPESFNSGCVMCIVYCWSWIF